MTQFKTSCVVHPILNSEIKYAINQMKNSKAPGKDHITVDNYDKRRKRRCCGEYKRAIQHRTEN